MRPVRNVATGLSVDELDLLREAVERHVAELQFFLPDETHMLTLEDADKLVDAIANELSLGEDGGLDERGIAFDNLISRVNLGPYMR